MNDTNRAEFEANGYKAAVFGDFIKNGDGTYALNAVQHRWEAWQAARAQPERVALSEADLDRMWLELTDEHVISKAAFFAAYRAILSVQPVQSIGNALTEESIIAAVKEWFPDRAYQAPFFAKAILASPPITRPLIAEAARDGVAGDAPAKGAARYEWLREKRAVLLITGFFGNGCINRTIEEVDDAIDAAIAASKGAQ